MCNCLMEIHQEINSKLSRPLAEKRLSARRSSLQNILRELCLSFPSRPWFGEKFWDFGHVKMPFFELRDEEVSTFPSKNISRNIPKIYVLLNSVSVAKSAYLAQEMA